MINRDRDKTAINKDIQLSDIKIKDRKRKIDQDKVKELAGSIKQSGLIHPITLDEHFNLLAGLHRIEAVKLLGWQDIPAIIKNGLDSLEAELIEIDENLIRHDLSPLQQGEWLNRRDIVLEEMGMRAKQGDNQFMSRGGLDSRPPLESRPVKTTEEIASEIGMAKSTTQQRKQVARNIVPEVKEQIYGTELEDRATDLLELSRMKPEEQETIVGKINSGEAKNVTQAKRIIVKETKKEPDPVTGKYRIFYADPPWNYGNSGLDDYGHAERHYPTMTISELCDMGEDIKKCSESNAVLFIWVTSPLLEDAFKVVNAWGFKYKTSFVWDKIKHNFGYYNSVRHELLLVCTKGSCLPDNKKLYDSVQNVERTNKHSEKPEVFREIIEDLYQHGNKLELFSRKETTGWESWGNE